MINNQIEETPALQRKFCFNALNKTVFILLMFENG